MWQEYISATTIEEVLQVLDEKRGEARIIAGGTDLILEMERKVRKGIKTLIDISRIPGLSEIALEEDGQISLGPLVTHNHCVQSKLIREYAFPLARAAWEVGSPQIRNRGTVVGNLITASPANDTITPLMSLGASVVLRSLRGERVVPLKDFYTGVRRTVLQPEEMLVKIIFPKMAKNQRGTYAKFALRRAQAISVLNAAVILGFAGDEITSAVVTLGAVAPTIIHAGSAEKLLVGKKLDEAVIAEAARLAGADAKPIDDIRGSAAYRQAMVQVVVSRALKAVASHHEGDHFPAQPVLLWGSDKMQPSSLPGQAHHDEHTPIVTRINGKEYTFEQGQSKTLLRLLREDAHLIGTKEGCAEGECGACTVFLDGIAVMSCMVPAPRAHGAEIVTIEGLSSPETMHPVQEAFVEEGAVQCGYCTPGFVMSAVKLLEERPHPTVNEIQQSLTGNLCRCTGYYKIVKAVEKAAAKGS